MPPPTLVRTNDASNNQPLSGLLPLIKARRTDFWLLQGEQLTRAGKDDVERGGMHSSNKAVRARTERN
jgi:hypothetical protein